MSSSGIDATGNDLERSGLIDLDAQQGGESDRAPGGVAFNANDYQTFRKHVKIGLGMF